MREAAQLFSFWGGLIVGVTVGLWLFLEAPAQAQYRYRCEAKGGLYAARNLCVNPAMIIKI